jgi:hypothetical protein
MNINSTFQFEKVGKIQNLGNVVYMMMFMHLSILIPGGKGAGNGWGFDKKFKNWVKCPLVGHSKIIKCFKTDAPRG